MEVVADVAVLVNVVMIFIAVATDMTGVGVVAMVLVKGTVDIERHD